MLEFAINAAQQAGVPVAKYFEMTGLEREVKDDKTFVTKADKEAEEIIVGLIQQAYPDHGILGEEGSDVNPGAEYQWIIDPIDGTGNFVNGIPIFGISIGLAHKGEPFIGVLYNPISNSLYSAEKGKGTTYNGKPVRVSSQKADEGIVTFGYGTKGRARSRELLHQAGNFMKGSRLLGCTALEMAYVSRGGTEGFVGLELNPWDYAAGALLITEAGGNITALDGGPWDLTQGSFLASNGHVHDELQQLLQAVP